MKRMGTLFKYVIWIVAFWILSDFLINVGLNSVYKSMEGINENTPSISNQTSEQQIQVLQAESTLVNGRISAILRNKPENNISNKFVKLEVYSKNNNLLGTRYIDIGELQENDTKPLDIYFKLKNVKKYNLTIVDQKGEEAGENLELLPNNISLGQVFWGVMIVLIIGG